MKRSPPDKAASDLAHKRWDKTTTAQRKKFGAMLAAARKRKRQKS